MSWSAAKNHTETVAVDFFSRAATQNSVAPLQCAFPVVSIDSQQKQNFLNDF